MLAWTKGVLEVTRQHFTWAARATASVFVSEFLKVVFSHPVLIGPPNVDTFFFAAHATKSLCFCKKSMNEKAEKLMNRYICPHILIKEVTMSATANVV
jgi:hypothetical protein